MLNPELDVIVAPATPRGPAPRAVLRLSGIGLLEQANHYLPADVKVLSGKRGVFFSPCEVLPGVSVDLQILCFEGPASATGEDVIEIHLPGSMPILDALMEQLQARGARLAEPGEFTRRAFLRGRLDLTQAEAVLELVQSRSQGSALSAARLLGGSLAAPLTQCRDVLLSALVELEAGLDFEEGDSQDLEPGEVGHYLAQALDVLRQGLAAEENRQLRHGGQFRVGLFGPPNAGKSSLFQTLSGKPSLISQHAGTTRDRREANWHIPQLEIPITLVDFPGFGGEAVDLHDASARKLAQQEDAALDLVWFCLPNNEEPSTLPVALPDAPVVILWTQADRVLGAVSMELKQKLQGLLGEVPEVEISSKTGDGVERLESVTFEAFQQSEDAHLQAARHSARHQQALREAISSIQQGQEWDAGGGHQDLVAEDIRSALASLAELVGEATPEDVLDRLFAGFCIGK